MARRCAHGFQKFSIEEFRERFNSVPFDQKPFIQVLPTSEPWAKFMLRAATALNRIIHEYEGKTIVIVCHGGIVDCSFVTFFGMSTLQFPQAYFDTHNTSITHWYKSSFEDLPSGLGAGKLQRCLTPACYGYTRQRFPGRTLLENLLLALIKRRHLPRRRKRLSETGRLSI